MKELVSKDEINEMRKKGLRPIVSVCIVNEKKLLMVYKEKHKLWQLPQGGIDNNENVLNALKREIAEEINYNFSNSLFDFKLVGNEKSQFPLKTQNSRELKTDEGDKIYMTGKKYYFITSQTLEKEINLSNSEFDKYKWLTYEDGLKLANKIYQTGKKRTTMYIIEKLHKDGYIK